MGSAMAHGRRRGGGVGGESVPPTALLSPKPHTPPQRTWPHDRQHHPTVPTPAVPTPAPPPPFTPGRLRKKYGLAAEPCNGRVSWGSTAAWGSMG